MGLQVGENLLERTGGRARGQELYRRYISTKFSRVKTRGSDVPSTLERPRGLELQPRERGEGGNFPQVEAKQRIGKRLKNCLLLLPQRAWGCLQRGPSTIMLVEEQDLVPRWLAARFRTSGARLPKRMAVMVRSVARTFILR